LDAKLQNKVIGDPRYVVYGVRGVAAIPLVEEHARTTLGTIASRHSLMPPVLGATPDSDGASAAARNVGTERMTVGPTGDQKSLQQENLIPQLDHPFDDSHKTTVLEVPDSSSARSSLSDESSHSSEHSISTSPIAKTLASRLSFWSRLSKRPSRLSKLPTQTEDRDVSDPESLPFLQEQELVNEIMDHGDEEPARMVDSILAATAPPPASVEEKQTELERKVIRECVKEFSKGGMYFAYNFGKFGADMIVT
jgi:phosphatidylinositol 4-phosphatase